MNSWAPLDWEVCCVLVLFQVTDLVWVPSACVCIVTCIYVLYKVSELFLWLKSSEKEQKKEEVKEESAWQVRPCGFGINDGCVY